jgi:hypothetical protein
MKVEPTTPDLLKRQLGKGKDFKKEWWFSPSHIYADVTEDEEKYDREKMSIMVRCFHDAKEWIMSEFKKQNWGLILDRIRNCLTEKYQTQLINEPRGKEMLKILLLWQQYARLEALTTSCFRKL